MRWSICTISHPDRHCSLDRLKMIVADQTADLPIEHVVVQAVGPVGELRQLALDKARGEYVNFVDDDDRIPAHYISTIFPLLDGVDYIGHRIQLFLDGTRMPPTIHSLRYRGWSQDANGYYRGVSHLNPLRADLARLARFEGGWGEDQRWAAEVEASGQVRSEHFVDEALYFYFSSTTGSLAHQGAVA